MFQRNVANQGIGFALLSAATGSPTAGLTVNVRNVKDGTAGAGGGTVTSLGGGQYWYAMSQGDTDAANFSLLFYAANYVYVEKSVVTTTAYLRNTSGQGVGFAMNGLGTGAGLAGLTVTVKVSVDDSVQGAGGGSVTDCGNGQYWYAMATADTNGNTITLEFTATGAITVEKTFVTLSVSPTITGTDNGNGTGGVITVAGSTSGSINTLYSTPWTGGGALVWTTRGNRVGNGTIPTTLQGAYLFEVRSGQGAVSNGWFMSLTDGSVDSVLNAILDQTVTGVAGLGLTLGGSSVPIVRKKVLRALLRVDPSPQITVVGEQLVDEAEWYAFPNTVKMTYKITIACIVQSRHDFEANLPKFTMWRQQLRKLFSKPGVYSSPVFDQNVRMGDLEDRSMFDNANQDVEAITVDVITTEPGTN